MKIRLKRTLALAMAFVIISSISSYAATFTDVKDKNDSWAFEYIEDMATFGYLNGMGDGRFEPGKNLTFMQTMAALSRFTLPSEAEKKDALKKHSDALDQMGLMTNWEREAVSISIEKGIITLKEAKDMAKNNIYPQPITKAGAGVFLAKAMGLEAKAQGLEVVFLDYKDTANIDSSIRKYVKVLQDVGVYSLEGDGNGYFHPKMALRRDVFAKMLSTGHYALSRKGAEKVEIVDLRATISRIENENLVILAEDDSEESFIITSETKAIVNGKEVKIDTLTMGMEVNIQYNLKTRELISVNTSAKEGKISGTVKGINSNTNEIIVEYLDGDTIKDKTFKLLPDARITKSKEEVKLIDIVPGDYIELLEVNGQISSMNTESGFINGKATISSIAQEDEIFSFIISDKENQVKELKIGPKTKIKRGGQDVEPIAIKKGDIIDYKANYDPKLNGFTAIEITGKLVEGTFDVYVKETITMAGKMPMITVENKTSKATETYEISEKVYVEIDGQQATHLPYNSGYIAQIEVNREGQITEMYIEALSRERSAAGRIKEINIKDKYIMLEIKEFSGAEETIEVYVTNSTKILDRELKTLRFIDLRVGDYLSVIGSYSGANFEATNISLRE